MTSRAQRRPQHFAVPDNYGVTAGWCAGEADLILLMGDRRRSGVRWRWWSSVAERMLGVLHEGATSEHADYYRQIGGLLRENGGFLVIAMAPGSAE